LNSDATLNLGAFEFTGSVISTTDSTPIVIDQASTISGDLTVGGDIIPSVTQGGNLGSLAKPFKSLYVSESTVYFAGVPLSIRNGTLLVNGSSVTAGSPDIGDITFAASTVSAPNEDTITVQAKDDDSFGKARLILEPVDGDARLTAFSAENTNTFTLSNADFATGVWQNNGYGIGVVTFTDAQNIGDFFQNTLQNLTPDNVTIRINGGAAFVWNGGTSGSGTDTPGLSNTPTVPPSPVAITSISFSYRSQSFISVNYNNSEIRFNAENASIRMDASNTIQMYGDSEIDLQAASFFRIAAEEDIYIETDSAYAVRVSGGDFVVSASDDVDIRGNDSFRLRNDSATTPIRIITDDDNNSYTWAFNPNGSLTIPGDIKSETAINIDINLSDSTLRRWQFGEDGHLTFPDGTSQSTAFTSGGTSDGFAYISTLNAFSGDFLVGTEQLVLVYNNGVANRTITLPTTPTNGQTITIKKTAAFTAWTVVIDGNSRNIDGAATLSFNNAYGFIVLVYSTAHSYNQWFVVGGNYSTVP